MWLYNVPEWKVNVVPNGIYPEKFFIDVDPGDVKKDYNIHPLAPLIFFVGRLVHQKGPDLLLDAVPKILNHRWDAKFLFAGDGGMRPHLESRASYLNGAVRFLGYLPDMEFLRLLNASDMVVIPSRNEPFGLVLLEAWSAQRCVVATDVGGLSENIDNFENGVKVFTTPDSLAWGVDYIINDVDRVKEMGENGKKKIEKKFRWQIIASKMIENYKGLFDNI
jgi:glycosyltransferase involved in cell wall biosynthesis